MMPKMIDSPVGRSIVAVLLMVTAGVWSAAVVAQTPAKPTDEDSEALRRMLEARRQQAEAPAAQDAQAEGEEPAEEQADPTDPILPLDLKLSGNEITIDTLSSGEIVILGHEADLELLRRLVEMIDKPPAEKNTVLHKLNNASAEEVADKLTSILDEIWPGSSDLPDQRIGVFAIASNMLLITAPPGRVDRIIEIANAIDEVVEPIPEFDAMKFFIKYRKATEIVEQLTQVIEKLQKKQGAKESEQITVEVNDADNSIVVYGPITLRQTIERLIEPLDVEPVKGFGHVKLVLFPLLNSTADDLAKVLTDMLATTSGESDIKETIRRLSIIRREADGTTKELPPLELDKPLRILSDKATNSLIIATVDENIEPLGEIVKLLDGYPIGHEMGMKIFPLRFADADSVKEMLKTMFEEGKKLPERAPGGEKTEAVPEGVVGPALVYNVGLAVDKRTNILLVTGRPEQLAVAQMVVSELDVPVSSIKFPLRLLFLGEHLDASRVKSIVEELFTKRIELLTDTESGKLAIAKEQVFLAADLRSNALIISASEENHQEIVSITQQLNVASARLVENIRILNCHNTSAADLASKIDELWQRKASLRAADDAPEDLPIVVADQRSNSMVIASSPEDFEEIKSLVERLEAQPLSPIAEIRLLTLKNNDAAQISDMLKQLFEERAQQRLAEGQSENPSDRVAVASDAATNTILMASSKENYDEMTRIIAVLDVEPIVEGVVRVYVLHNAEAKDVSDRVKELFDQGLYNPMAGVDSPMSEARNKVALVADARSNAIIASASKPNLSIIETLIKQMDGENSAMLSEDTKIHRLEHADAVKLADTLDKLFEGLKAEAPEPDLVRKPTVLPDARSNALIISGARDALKRCEDLLKQLDRPAGPPTSVFEVYTLKHGAANKLATKMQDLFDKRSEGAGAEEVSTPILISADETSNSLIASASRDDHALIRGLLDLLDKPSSIARQFEIFPLQKAKADAVSETLGQLFEQQGDGAAGRADAIAVQPDARSNSLVVWASSSEMENIRTIIEKLDTAKPAVDMMMRVIRLKQALAEDFAELLTDTLQGGDAGGGDEGNAVILSFKQKLADGSEAVRKLVRQDITIKADTRTNSLMVMAPAESMDLLEAMILDFDQIQPVTAEIRIFPLANADSEEVVDRLKEIFGTEDQGGSGDIEQRIVFGAGEGGAATAPAGGEGGSTRTALRFTADRRTNSVIAAGHPVDLKMAEQLVRELDAQDIEDRVQQVYQANYKAADTIADALTSFVDKENEIYSDVDDQTAARRLAEKKVSVVGDAESGSILLGASPRYYAQYTELLREIDRPEPQVMISVLIAEVTMDDRLEFGVEFALQDLNFSEKAVTGPNGVIQGNELFDSVIGTDIGASGAGFGGLSLTVSGEDFSFLMRALQSQGQFEVLSRPTLLVQNNATGNITIGDRVPIVTGTSSAGGQSSTTIQYEEVGIILDVTPHINPDGYVNLEIKPEISQIGSQVPVSEGLSATTFSERSAETTVTVKDGETVILGGLITEDKTDSVVKVPILGDIPVFGEIFKSTTKSSSKTELLIVLTVTVLRDETELREQSEKELSRTGRFPSSIRRSPLMGGLRIRPEEEAFGPVGEPSPAPSEPASEPQPTRHTPVDPPRKYGPVTPRYGPPRPLAAPQLGSAMPMRPAAESSPTAAAFVRGEDELPKPAAPPPLPTPLPALIAPPSAAQETQLVWVDTSY